MFNSLNLLNLNEDNVKLTSTQKSLTLTYCNNRCRLYYYNYSVNVTVNYIRLLEAQLQVT